MLVLSRKQGQAIEIPQLQIVVRVTAITHRRVQLGIEAPEYIKIHRGELVPRNAATDDSPPADRSRDRGLSSGEFQRVLDELVRLEAELSAVAELADPRNRGIAQRVAADAIQRIEGIERSLRMTRQRRSEVQPIADLVKVRAEVLERLRHRNEPGTVECCEAS